MIKGSKRLVYIGLILVVVGVFFIINFLSNREFYYAGTLEATYVDISARLAAAINEIRVKEGDRVTIGQPLITFACEDFKIEAKFAEEEYGRNIKLLKGNFIPPSELDKYKTQLDSTHTKIEWCTLLSPIDGKVLSRYHEPGEWMVPGTKILTLANIHDIWAYIYVPQPQLAKISLGMKVRGYCQSLKIVNLLAKLLKLVMKRNLLLKMYKPRKKGSG